MKLFGSPTALAHLEIQDTVRSVRHGLHGCGVQHARLFQFADRLPVCCGRTALHQIKRLFLDTAHDIMLHRRICCRNCFRFFVPGRIIVPGNKINNVGKLVIIQSLEIIHHIDGSGLFGTGIPQRADLPLHKIGCLICYKSFPVQIQSVQRCVSFWRRTLHLIKTLVCMTPERRVPCMV